MAVFKCKMCGGALDIGENQSTAVCEYCGTKQTLPKLDDERREQMYDRANHFRRNNDYDKAMGMYEKILNEDNTDSEAYWSLVLCRYGIEYVEDPSTHKRIPTVNRTQFTSIFDDEDYKSALQYADSYQKSIYEEEANAINDIQKGILAISQKEKPFDVFICYKETDEAGVRTRDSVIANDLYHELTEEGFKVFFSRITLEDKLGSAYEPYIFAALNSAKVMVVVGTKPEYFNAVWVKNEWSRYLTLIKNGAKKSLIPAYRDMDPYDLPEEFSHLQAQDMSKLGFMQDLIRGIKKLTEADETEQVERETAPKRNGTDIEPLLKRVFMFLEDKDFQSADEYCERVLDQDPENARAYLGKMMAELKVSRLEDLKQCEISFDNLNNYKKIIRFGDENLKTEIQNIVLQKIYRNAKTKMDNAITEYMYKEAAEGFKKISGFQDADELMKQCEENGEICRKNSIYENAMYKMQKSVPEYDEAKTLFESIQGWKDADELMKQCEEKAREWADNRRKETLYRSAMAEKAKNTKESYEKAIKLLSMTVGFKDSDEQLVKCENLLSQIEAERIAAARRNSISKKIKAIILILAVCIVIFLIVFNTLIMPPRNYSRGLEFMGKGQYAEAAACFNDAKGYKDSENQLRQCLFRYNEKTISAGATNALGVKPDGTVIVTKYIGDPQYNHGQCDVSGWTNIAEVAGGNVHSVGLRKDGTVTAIGANYYGQCSVSGWKDIVAVSAGTEHTVGLKSDSTVVATGNNKYDQCNVSYWKDILSVSAGGYHTVGLKTDGTVVAEGDDSEDQCSVSSWDDIKAVAAGSYHTVGLREDGTVVARGNNDNKQCKVSDWTDITAIAVGDYHTVGLKSDGTVVAVGNNEYGQCNVLDWTDIVAISANSAHTIGLKSDGTVVAAGNNDYGQCNVYDFTDIHIAGL